MGRSQVREREGFSMKTLAREGDLKVWWIPQVPGAPFEVPVPTQEEGVRLLNALAAYDLFQLAHHIKPDYSNAGGLLIFCGGDWEDWDEESA